MKAAYPVIFTDIGDGYMAYMPDFEINTQGDTLAEAVEMARDAMGIIGIDMEDDGKELPCPSAAAGFVLDEKSFVSMVDIDFAEYRRENDLRTAHQNEQQ